MHEKLTKVQQDALRVQQAVCFAANAHGTQLRKGSDTPYILHPMEVCCILSAMGADTDLMIAGLLHDTLEDTGTTREEIRDAFGEEVLALVCAHTEDKSKTWQERKSRTIRELVGADVRLQMLVLSDKLANLRSMVRDYNTLGEALWGRFRAPREKQAWYHRGGLESLSPLLEVPQARWAMLEAHALADELFGPKES